MSDPRQQQELEEFEQWLASLDAETVRNLDEHMQKMWQSFNETFGNQNSQQKPKEAKNGTHG